MGRFGPEQVKQHAAFSLIAALCLAARRASAQDTTIHVDVRLVRMLVTVKDAQRRTDRLAEQERFHCLRQRRQAGNRRVRAPDRTAALGGVDAGHQRFGEYRTALRIGFSGRSFSRRWSARGIRKTPRRSTAFDWRTTLLQKLHAALSLAGAGAAAGEGRRAALPCTMPSTWCRANWRIAMAGTSW